MTPVETLLSEADRYKWQPIEREEIATEIVRYFAGYSFNKHEFSQCLGLLDVLISKNLIAKPSSDIVAKLAAALRVAVDYIGCSEEVVPEALAKINAICQDPLSKGRASEGK